MADEIAEVIEEEILDTEVEEDVEPESEATEEQSEGTEEEEAIPVRSNASFIIERQKRTIEKLRSEESQEDPITERLNRIEEIALGQSDDKDLTELFEKEPDAKKYASKIRTYMDHDAYKGVSPEVIYHHLDYSEAKTKVDSKRKAADLEARQTRSVGSGIRDTRSSDKKTADDIKNMPMKDFEEYDRELQRQARS